MLTKAFAQDVGTTTVIVFVQCCTTHTQGSSMHNAHSLNQQSKHTHAKSKARFSPRCLSQQRQHSPACLQWPRRACRGTRSPSVQRRSSGVQRLALLDCKHSLTHTLRSKLCSCTFSVFIMTACTAAHCVSRLSFSRLTSTQSKSGLPPGGGHARGTRWSACIMSVSSQASSSHTSLALF